MSKTIKISPANPDQFFLYFGVQNDLQNHGFWYPKSYCRPEANLRRSKSLPRWLEKLSNGSNRGSISFQEASEGVQKNAKLPPRSPSHGENGKLQCKTTVGGS